MIYQLLKCLLTLALVTTVCLGSDEGEVSPEELAGEVEAIIARAELGRFWGAVVIRVGDENILSRGYGFENRDLNTIDPEVSLFDVGSIAKSVTAATILKLIEEEKLELSTTMLEVFGEEAQSLSTVTVEQLLRHQSGLGAGTRMLSRAAPLDSIDALIHAVAQANLGPKEFAYSNAGYFVLAAVIERVGDGTFEKITRNLVFEEAKLAGIGFVGDGKVNGTRPTTRIKKGHNGSISQGSLFEYPWNWGQRGATGVVMTAQAAANWFEAIESGDWLSDASRETMLNPSPAGYGLGLYVDINEDGLVTQYWHGGSTGGYVCHAARYPLAFNGKGATVILMTQSTINLQPIIRQIHRLIQPPTSKPVSAGIYLNNLDEYETDGVYTINQGLKWVGKTQYIGSDGTKRIVDERPTLILEHQTKRMWTLIIRMDEAQAQNLIEELSIVSTQIANDPKGGTLLWSRGTTLITNVQGLQLTEYNSYLINEGATVSVRASTDHYVVLVITTPDGMHEIVQVRMGGAEVRQLQNQLRSAMP